jgi:hypothetical protein
LNRRRRRRRRKSISGGKTSLEGKYLWRKDISEKMYLRRQNISGEKGGKIILLLRVILPEKKQ